jgi:hypothetical protein
MPDSVNAVIVSSGLCVAWNKYYLGYFNELIDTWSRISDVEVECGEIDSLCRVLKNEWWVVYPLTNSFVHFENISFIVTNTDVPKVNINITARPTYNKGLSPNIIDNNTMHIQTTISERLIETN